MELRRTLLLPLDDLLAVTREFINPDVSRSGLDRCLRRHEVADLKSLQPEQDGQVKPLKTFKDFVGVCLPVRSLDEFDRTAVRDHADHAQNEQSESEPA